MKETNLRGPAPCRQESSCTGACCEDIFMSRGPESLQFLLELAKDHGDDAKLADMQQVVDMLIPIGRTPESLWRYSCKNFDPVKRKCRIYDSRPTLCREYGTEKNPCEHRGCQWKDAVHSYDVKTPT